MELFISIYDVVNAIMHGRAIGRRRSLCSANAAQQCHNVVLFPADHAADGQFEGGSRPDCREASERTKLSPAPALQHAALHRMCGNPEV